MSEKIVIYVAGPFSAETEYRRRKYIAQAEAIALELWRMGYAVICPHLNTAHFDGEAPDTIWLEGDLELVRRSDAVFAGPGWYFSTGAKTEINLAESVGIPVFTELDQAEEYLREKTSHNKEEISRATETE